MSIDHHGLDRSETTRSAGEFRSDRSNPLFFFLTIWTYERQVLFGQIDVNAMRLTRAGRMLGDTILQIESIFAGISVDCSVVMPNHIHVLFKTSVGLPDEEGKLSVEEAMQFIKNSSTKQYSEAKDWPSYKDALWDEEFHVYSSRDNHALEKLRSYVASNVELWTKDRFYSQQRLDWWYLRF